MKNANILLFSFAVATITFSGRVGLSYPVLKEIALAVQMVNESIQSLAIEPARAQYTNWEIDRTQIPIAYLPVPVAAPAAEVFYYSYYYPDLLAPGDVVDGVCANQIGQYCVVTNCFDYDIVAGRCRSPMSSGLDWHDYVGKSVACGFEYSLGTIFRVLAPLQVAGDYPCLDYCPRCSGTKQLDFLSAYQVLPWNAKLVIQVIP